MAVEPNEIPVVGEEVAGGAGEEPVAPSDKPSEPELAEGEVVPLEEFRRLEENVDRLQSVLQSKAADAEARAEEAERRAELAIRYAEDGHTRQERDGLAYLASLDEEEREKQRPQFEAWRAESKAELQRIRNEAVNVPARERRKVAEKFGIDVKELGDLEDPVQLRDKALEVLKAQKVEKPTEPEEPVTPKKKATITRRGPLQPTGGAPPPAPPARVTSADVQEAARVGDMERVKELKKVLAEQRKKDEAAI